MKQYSKEKPLIAIHVPKTGGTSFRKILEQWFGRNLYLHYYDPANAVKPKKVRLKKRFSNKFRETICIYGHFPNRIKGLGIKSHYPEVDQFITILRDPFERAVSSYFHKKSTNVEQWKDKLDFEVGDLANYLSTIGNNSLNHFPFEIKSDDYQELIIKNFIHIGITEDMDTSVKLIAKKLGFEPPKSIEFLNNSNRAQKIPYELKQAFMDKHQMEYAVYDFAKENFNKS